MPSENEKIHSSSIRSQNWEWKIIATLLITLYLVPGLILWGAMSGGGLPIFISWTDTLVALPMIPALLLGAVGVWTAVSDVTTTNRPPK